MAKIVYGPTQDRKGPAASNIVKAKIANKEIKVKGKQSKAKREAKSEKPITEPTKEDLEGFLAVLKGLGKPSSSREISDALGIKDADKGRALVRRMMSKLAEQSKVKITKEGDEYRYSLP